MRRLLPPHPQACSFTCARQGDREGESHGDSSRPGGSLGACRPLDWPSFPPASFLYAQVLDCQTLTLVCLSKSVFRDSDSLAANSKRIRLRARLTWRAMPLQAKQPVVEEEEAPTKKSGGGGLFGNLFGPAPAEEGTTYTLQGRPNITLVAGEGPKVSIAFPAPVLEFLWQVVAVSHPAATERRESLPAWRWGCVPEGRRVPKGFSAPFMDGG